ncbi:uncharacterized protein LOC126913011 [Spodoptera frugiperda]|uniref:Uncharacterized protein LOC126913011 n=1 Tax=Spodoptera frugiperda TaxID=7108 RepID=A0A9R0EE97_SPOFR|nr:uncharacterized protein LOC126913011 [Spodoptera frugiperda]
MKQKPGTQVIQCTLNRQKPVKAAIVIFGNNLEVIHDPQLVSENVVAVLLKAGPLKFGVLSVYYEGDQDLDSYLDDTQHKMHLLKTNNILIGGDVNAWSQWWGSVSENHRGALYNAFLNDRDLQILNMGQTPTFEVYRGDRWCTSVVDVTACSLSMLDRVEEWRVERSLTTSDHNAITFSVRLEKALKPLRPITTRIYNTKKAKWSDFSSHFKASLAESAITPASISGVTNPMDLETIITKYTKNIHRSCEEAIPKLGSSKRDTRPPWWTPSLHRLQKDALRKKRRIRNAAPARRQFVIQEYVAAKNEYTTAAEEAATASWKEFCSKQDRESMWDSIYRVIRKTAKRQNDALLRNTKGETLSPVESAELLAKTFYPDDSTDAEQPYHKAVRRLAEEINPQGLSADDPPFSIAELEMVLQNQNPKKAPGPDGLTADICTAAIDCDREVFLAIANRCLSLPHFPKQWKTAHVCILRKPGKDDYTNPKSYRPIGLLSVLGKIVEKLLVGRLQWHFLPKLNKNQYGFMPQRGTEDALYDLIAHIRAEIKAKKIVLLISLDIEGAFDNAWWPALKKQMVVKGCPKNLYNLVNSYLKDRNIVVNYARATSEKGTTKGCVQGSIAGPTFWNLILDSLLQKVSSRGIHCQAFADDVVLVISDHTTGPLQQAANEILDIVSEWGAQNKLRFAAHKTNAMVLTKKLKYDLPELYMSGTRLNLVQEVKLLGLIIDHKLTFNAHVSATCKKAADIYKQLACAARVTWGLNRDIIRTIYVSVVEPIVMYAASAWAPAAEKLMSRNQFDSLQRGFAQKICKAYRTVSLTSALILSGQLPLDLRVIEAATLFKIKKGHSQEFIPPGRELERNVHPSKNPHPAILISTDYARVEDWTPETLETHKISGPQIYTDGSKIEGKVGAALTWWENGKESSFRTFGLEPHNTVFQSEMYALFRAVRLVRESNAASVSILSDSRSSLDLLRSPVATHNLALEIKKSVREIRQEGREVRFFWLRAHVGTEGNERADELAKEAALKKETADYTKVPISYVRGKIRERTILKWQARYETSSTGSVTKVFFPDVREAKRILGDTVLTPTHVQVLTGHGGFSAYLHRFHLKDSPSCVCDSACEESVWHLLFECPRFSPERMELEIKIGIQLDQSTLHTIMGKLTTRKPFLAFASRVAVIAAEANKTDASFRGRNRLPSSNTPLATTQQPATASVNATHSAATATVVPQTTTTKQTETSTTSTTGNLQTTATTHPTTQQSAASAAAAAVVEPSPQQNPNSMSIAHLLACGGDGVPGIRLRGVALFMNREGERLGISYCIGTSRPRARITISPGLAALINGSTTKSTIKGSKYAALPQVEVATHRCRLMRHKGKTIALFEWGVETPFAQASSLLRQIGEAGGDPAFTARTISVDAMAVGGERGEVADRFGCLKASEHHEVVVYEDRGETLSFLKAPRRLTACAASPSTPATQSGSERAQQKAAADKAEQNKTRCPEDRVQSRSRLKVFGTFLNTLLPTATRNSNRQETAVERFFSRIAKPPTQPKPTPTRADKGQVSPPILALNSGVTDHVKSAFLEYVAVVRATREVNLATCKKIMQTFRRETEGLLRVLLEEAGAAVYDNSRSIVIKGEMEGSYMAAFSESCGFVYLDTAETDRLGKIKFSAPEDDPMVVTAKCTKVMLEDRILAMAQTILENQDIQASSGSWVVPNIRWVNGVPGCGKTTWVVKNFDGERDVVATTTTEAAKDLREKLARRLGDKINTKVRTMASILANGFKNQEKCYRLTVDEALMNHFGSIVMAAKLSGASELVLIGDINQLPFLDRENLFQLRYTRPDLVAGITQELLCTHRNPMDVAYTLSDIYSGIYASKSSLSQVHSLSVRGYTGAQIQATAKNTLFLVHTQEEKTSLVNKGYGSGEGSRLMTIHEAQGLTCDSVIIINTKSRRLQVHNSVSHAVVAVSRHTNSCVYYSDDAEDAIGRFAKKAMDAPTKTVVDYNLKTAMQHRDASVIEPLLKLAESLAKRQTT